MRRPADLRIVCLSVCLSGCLAVWLSVWLAGWLAGWRLTGGSAAEGPKIAVSLCGTGIKKHCRKGGNP